MVDLNSNIDFSQPFDRRQGKDLALLAFEARNKMRKLLGSKYDEEIKYYRKMIVDIKNHYKIPIQRALKMCVNLTFVMDEPESTIALSSFFAAFVDLKEAGLK